MFLLTIQYTLWSPDTCGCSIMYSWDDEEPGETRQHSIHEIIKACSDHEHLALVGKEHHYNTVLEENRRKNITHGKLGIEKLITWEWLGEAPNRTLHVFHEGKKLAQVEAKK